MTDDPIHLLNIPLHSAGLYAFRRHHPVSKFISDSSLSSGDYPSYLGSNLHFTCGKEIKHLTYPRSGVNRVKRRFHIEGEWGGGFIWLFLGDDDRSGRGEINVASATNSNKRAGGAMSRVGCSISSSTGVVVGGTAASVLFSM